MFVRSEIQRRAVVRNCPLNDYTASVACGQDVAETTAIATLRAAAAAGWPQLVVLAGVVGSGKSSAAAWAVVRHAAGGWFSTRADYYAGSNARAMRRWLSAPLLAIDDVGFPRDTPIEADAFIAEVLARRVERYAPTIVLAYSATPAAMLARLASPELAALLPADGAGWWHALPERDLRVPATMAALRASRPSVADVAGPPLSAAKLEAVVRTHEAAHADDINEWERHEDS